MRGRRVARAAYAGLHGQRAVLCMNRSGLSEPRGGQRSCKGRRRCCPSVAKAGRTSRGLQPLVRTDIGRGFAWAAAGSVSRPLGSAAARTDAAAARVSTAGGASCGLLPPVRTGSGRHSAWATTGSVSCAVGSAAARSDATSARLLRQRAARCAGGALRGLPTRVCTDSGRCFAWAAAGSVSHAVGSAAARSDVAAARLLRQRAARRAGCRRWSAWTLGFARAAASSVSRAVSSAAAKGDAASCCPSVAAAGGTLRGLPPLVRTSTKRG